jgi:hypothetical protein
MRATDKSSAWSAEADMTISGNRGRIIAGGLAALLALASGVAATATPVSTDPAVFRAPVPNHYAATHWRGVRVPAGILAGVPTGSIPGGARLRTVYPPYPVAFSADPYFSPPAVVIAPPPIVFAPPPFLYDVAPIWLPFDGGCFVPSDNVGLHGYFGACADAFYQQRTSRPD